MAITILILLLCKPALAADDSLWLTSGLRSWHNNQDQEQFRENNNGIGLSYEMPHDINIVTGTYMNSDDKRTNYFGAMFQPLEIFGVHLGILGAFFTGYTSADFETTVIPMASYEYKSVGINLFWIPAKVTALQLKFKLAEF